MNMCKDCGEEKVFRFTVGKVCFYEKYCAFCKTLTLKEECKGHMVHLPTTNRFMEDSQFTGELMYEMEQ